MPDDTRGATEAFEDRVVEDQSAEIRLTYEELAKFKAFLTQSGATEVSIGGHYLVVLDSNALAEMKSVRNELVHWGAPDAAQRSVLVEQLLRLMSVIDEVQAEHADAARPTLLKAMLSADIDPIPSATIAQARRLAQQRERLTASGAYTIEALAICGATRRRRHAHVADTEAKRPESSLQSLITARHSCPPSRLIVRHSRGRSSLKFFKPLCRPS